MTTRSDALFEKLADSMDPEGARQWVNDVIAEAFTAGFEAGVDAIDANGEQSVVAAKHQGSTAIGIEIEERYCEIAATRLQQGALVLE